jgi:hypothetical protein
MWVLGLCNWPWKFNEFHQWKTNNWKKTDPLFLFLIKFVFNWYIKA